MSIADSFNGLLGGKKAAMIALDILEMIETSQRYIEIALVKMQIEAADFAKRREEELLLPFMAQEKEEGNE